MSTVRRIAAVTLATLACSTPLLAKSSAEIVARAPTGVTPKAERLLAASAEPRRLQLRPSDNLLSVARRLCGRLTDTYVEILLQANKGEKAPPDTVVIPACFATRLNENVKVIPGESWTELATRSVGVAGTKTLSGIFASNSDSPVFAWSRAFEPIPRHLKQIEVPVGTEPVAYQVKPGIDATAFVAELNGALGAPAALTTGPTAEPELKLEAGVDPAVGGTSICPSGGWTTRAWPFSIPDFSVVMNRSVARYVELGGERDKVGAVAVIDNGVDGIFTSAFPEEDFVISVLERAKPSDGLDQDNSGFADDVVGTNIYQGGQPVALPGPPGAAGVAAPAHGTMMSSLSLGGIEYRTWAQQTSASRRVKIRPVSIVRHTVETSTGGNTHKYAMPTDSLGKAIDYAARNGATILNLSVSTPIQLASVEDALYNRANLLLVVAAGNSRVNLDQRALYPAGLSNFDNAYRGRVVTVAAHNAQGCLSSFSGRGKDSVDLAAPGENIRAVGLNGIAEVGEGTSQATALVSFTAAQLRSIGMDQARSIKERLIASADLNAAFIGHVRSEGALNIPKALDIYQNVLELAASRTPMVGELPFPLTVSAVCPSLSADDRKILKASRRIDGGAAGQMRLLAVSSDDRGRMEVLHCAPSNESMTFKLLNGSNVQFRWSEVWDLVPAV